MVSDWFQEYRYNWIIEMVQIYGFIGRDHIRRKFRVSTPQASADIAEVMKRNPGLMDYDTRRKCYVLSEE